MELNPKETALVLIEFQNDFTTEGGIFHSAVKGVMDANNMLHNTADTVKAARVAGINIIYVPISFTSDYHEVTPKPYGIMKGVVDNGAFKKDTWGTEFSEMLTPEKEDIIIEGKRSFCGFASTNLDFVLRSRGIKNVVLAGYLTNCCVESTMRTAYDKGYNVITLTDCCATLSQEEHDNALKSDFPMFSQPMSHTELISILTNETVLELKGKGYE
ncbi:cysteine hydrolase [Dyadobacter psychrotolerans]|uniref:Cysteine hydrolase n=1 Tax=Dyadobacter psychrotolerans TaxID=2541721 RepID=A0A4R5DMZ7_9BACT|nr:cysteine hydrolase [Dyadobacter psychrotolerans]TDE15682.1 cysteine hydrolase [Dyadobacter psychrotolerans]